MKMDVLSILLLLCNLANVFGQDLDQSVSPVADSQSKSIDRIDCASSCSAKLKDECGKSQTTEKQCCHLIETLEVDVQKDGDAKPSTQERLPKCSSFEGFSLTYTRNATYCLWLSTESVNYDRARDDCVHRGSNISFIGDFGKLFTIFGLYRIKLNMDLDQNKIPLIWNGARRFTVGYVFTGETGETMTRYSVMWYRGQPDGEGECISTGWWGAYKDIKCNESRLYVCELWDFREKAD